MSPDFRNALPPGTPIAEYKLQRVLGAGGFGITYLARDEELDRLVAIKEYLPLEFALREGDRSVHPRSESDAATYEWGLTRFREEAQTLVQFDGHPNIVRVLRYLAANNTAYMVMQYEDGEGLRHVLERRGALPEEEIRALVGPLLAGLAVVHRAGVLHRDIKPGNIYVRSDGSPVLLDFGAARQAVGERSRSMTAVLTPPYAPLEQYGKGQPQGPWTDIYALGVVVYEALSGRKPPDATDRVFDDTLEPLPNVARFSCSAALADGVRAALRVKGAERPQTVDAWRAILWRPQVPDEPPPPRESPWASVGAAAILVLIVVGLYVISHQGDNPQAPSGPASTAAPAAQAPASPREDTAVTNTVTETRELLPLNCAKPSGDAEVLDAQTREVLGTLVSVLTDCVYVIQPPDGGAWISRKPPQILLRRAAP
jgi:serine/threonine protein kinase